MKNKRTFWRVLYTLLIGALALTMVLPFLWMISTSFKIEGDVFEFPIRWIPSTWNFQNYPKAWNSTFNFSLAYWNTVKVSVITTALQVLISATAAYAFAKIHFRHSRKLFMLYLSTLMIPSQVTIIPCFMIFKWIGLIDSHAGIIILSSFSVYGMFLLRQFMSTIPGEMSEAAIIDGANHFQIFTTIALPMTKPAIATLAMLKFIWTWNDYQNPLIFLISPRLFTLQLGMRSFSSEYGNQYALTMAAAVLAVLPLMAVFLICQRHVIEGIAIGAVKG